MNPNKSRSLNGGGLSMPLFLMVLGGRGGALDVDNLQTLNSAFVFQKITPCSISLLQPWLRCMYWPFSPCCASLCSVVISASMLVVKNLAYSSISLVVVVASFAFVSLWLC